MKSLIVISHSGGLDSTTLLYKALNETNSDIILLNFNYGQENVVEMLAQKNIIENLKGSYRKRIIDKITINLNSGMGSVIQDSNLIRESKKVKEKTSLEYYTPFRNLLFCSISSMVGEIASIYNDYQELKVGLGIHQHKTYKNYWDITPKFAEAFDNILKLNDGLKCSLYAPYKGVDKKEIIKDTLKYNVPYELTWTCYSPRIVSEKFLPCTECESCTERLKMGEELGIYDINDYYIEKI